MVSLKKLALLALGAVQVQAQCVGPAINSAALNLIKEFEGWRPNICEFTMSFVLQTCQIFQLTPSEKTATLSASLPSDTATSAATRAAPTSLTPFPSPLPMASVSFGAI